MKRLKLLIKKFKRIKLMKEELSMYAYKPERMTSDDEEEWIEEEKEIYIKRKFIRKANGENKIIKN